MARPLRIEYAGAFYHIIQRGNEKKAIFKTQADRIKFLEYIGESSVRYKAKVHGYCLMDNHYHLILETRRANLKCIMHDINTGYSVYFNIKHNRSGHLFQGRYKSILVQADEYLHYLSCYIHLNPVRAKMVKSPGEYLWTSYNYFISDVSAVPEWMATDLILLMFDKDKERAKKLYKKFVEGNIGKKEEIIAANTVGGFILGDEDFVSWIKEKFIGDKDDQEIPEIKELKEKVGLEEIREKVNSLIKGSKLARQVGIYLSRKYSGKSLKEIADFYEGIGYSGVSHISSRLGEKRKADKLLDAEIKRAEEIIAK